MCKVVKVKQEYVIVYSSWLIIKPRERLLWYSEPYKLGSYIINYFFIFTGECFSRLQFFFAPSHFVKCIVNCNKNKKLLWLFMQIYLFVILVWTRRWWIAINKWLNKEFDTRVNEKLFLVMNCYTTHKFLHKYID